MRRLVLNERNIERKVEKAINMLGIAGYVNIEFSNERTNGRYGCMMKEYGMYKVIVYVNEHNSEKEIIHTICHELRHVWQMLCGYSITGKYKKLYYATYKTNLFEIDADRFGDMMAYGKKYKANEEGLYINNIHIVMHGIHTMVAKAIA